MYYFASDIHLGLSIGSDTREREALLVRWLEEVSVDARAIFLVGDVFDFWYEYRRVVPKGFTRLLGKLSELTDRGIPIHFYTGNHDMWAYRYLHDECGVTLHHEAYSLHELYGRRVAIGHGDALWKSLGLKFVWNKVFRFKPMRRLFELIHPNLALYWGQHWSRSSRLAKPLQHTFRGDEEPIVKWARNTWAQEKIDLFVCGHIHCAVHHPLTERVVSHFWGSGANIPRTEN